MKTNFLAISKKILICALTFTLCLTCVACKKTTDDNSSSPSSVNGTSNDSVFDANSVKNENDNDVSVDSSANNSSINSSQNKPASSQDALSSETTTSSNKPTSSSDKSSSSTTPSASLNNSSNVSSTTPSKSETTKLIISCWGDSLTEGMGLAAAYNYPSVLGNYLDKNKYTVLNGGDGGEDSITIMARQGGVKIYTSNKISFKEGEVEVKIGNGSGNGFETAEGDVIRLCPPLGREMPINDITIGTEKYQVVQKNFNWTGRTCDVYLKRTTNLNKAVTVEKGTEVKFASADIAKTNHCDIYLMGGNGGYKNDVNTLIAQHKKMIEHRGNDNYLVLIPYWTSSNATKAFKDAFGDKAVDFLTHATNQEILENELQITLSDIDKQYVSLKRDVPPCLKLNNDPNQGHMNEKGYKLLAKVIYEQGIELGYWK